MPIEHETPATTPQPTTDESKTKSPLTMAMTAMTGSAIRLDHNNTVVDGDFFDAVPPQKSAVPQRTDDIRARKIGMSVTSSHDECSITASKVGMGFDTQETKRTCEFRRCAELTRSHFENQHSAGAKPCRCIFKNHSNVVEPVIPCEESRRWLPLSNDVFNLIRERDIRRIADDHIDDPDKFLRECFKP